MSGEKQGQRGVTLIELLVVMIVIAILASIAIPSYRAHTMKVRRSDAKITLSNTAQRLERCFTRYNKYNEPKCNITFPIPSEHGAYVITPEQPIGDTAYRLLATAQAAQANDTRCGNLTLDQLGLKGKTGTAPVAECW